MLNCDKQTYKDLEFDVIIKWMEEYCVGSTALNIVKNLKPIDSRERLIKYLEQTNELLSIRTEGETFPRIEFEELSNEIRMLPVKNASLPLESFQHIKSASILVNSLIYFFNKREEEYPQLYSLLENLPFTKEIINAIDEVLDKKGGIKDDASPKLFEIRQRILSARRQSNNNFDRELRKWLKKGYLSDTKEAFFDNKRQLAVISSYKRMIPGHVTGSSKSGGVTYVEPESTFHLNNEIEQLQDDERSEIFLILKELTSKMVVHLPLIKDYQNVLTKFDFINVKCRLALSTSGVLPAILDNKKLDLIDAFHPVLKKSNDDLGKETVPQHITMDESKRMLVISGPNAGGKSITLKTVGLLQLMLQCGLLVPVHPNSKMCTFNSLLTDIGDNQSIVNELSTYSYRLKRMRYFLSVADENSMLLLDEFGTGSDPDLGGALAEVFFETLYAKKCFGVITTHYGNIKLKADELEQAVNGCMLFDTNTLQPLFKFSIGQPGSSFTFEVAQINGIPKELITRAKTKLDHKKVKMDRLLNELQKEKTYLSKLNKDHIEAQEIAEESRLNYEESKLKLDDKLNQLKNRAEETNKLISLGEKLKSFVKRYKTKGKGKNVNAELMAEIKKYIAIEKSKIEEVKKEVRLKTQSKKKKDQPKKQRDQFHQTKIKIGSTVKLIATKQKGVVEEIENDDVTVTFGFMRMKVKLNNLMWVKD
ncbi:MAG: DNA mismatch repair protein MutS [Fluviicola sp.]|nr:MAG: DNA mismatch repair protein MutS [Fluviicola sp.]